MTKRPEHLFYKDRLKLSKCMLLVPTILVIRDVADLYGTAKVMDRVTHAPLLDAAVLKAEWPQARLMLLRKAARLGVASSMKVFLDFHAELLFDLSDVCPAVSSLTIIMLCIPAQKAEVERGFSVQNLKSKF
jgi:hypothetical protein